MCICVFKSPFLSTPKKKKQTKNISFIARPSPSFALHLFSDHVAVNLAFLHLSMSVSMLTVTVFHAGVSGIWSYLINWILVLSHCCSCLVWYTVVSHMPAKKNSRRLWCINGEIIWFVIKCSGILRILAPKWSFTPVELLHP